jgi:hypothetical protein
MICVPRTRCGGLQRRRWLRLIGRVAWLIGRVAWLIGRGCRLVGRCCGWCGGHLVRNPQLVRHALCQLRIRSRLRDGSFVLLRSHLHRHVLCRS